MADMAIQRITSFEGTADVLASIRKVRYVADDNTLAIEALSAEDALMVLRRLSTGEVAQLDVAAGADGGTRAVVETAKTAKAPERVRVGGNAHGQPVTASAQAAAPRAEPAKETLPKAAPEAAPPKPAAPQNTAVSGTVPRKRARARTNIQGDMDAASDPATMDDAPSVPEERAPAASAPAPAPAQEAAPESGGSNGVPPELVNAKKLRDVVSYYYDSGVTKPDAIVAKCLEVQKKVKTLARIKNLEDRVRRAMDVLGLMD